MKFATKLSVSPRSQREFYVNASESKLLSFPFRNDDWLSNLDRSLLTLFRANIYVVERVQLEDNDNKRSNVAFF